jgi:hypothetical protein
MKFVPTPDDISGGITDAGKLLLRDEGYTLDAPGEAHYDETNGYFYLRDSLGIFNPRDFNPGGPPGTSVYARVGCPVIPQTTSSSTYVEVGTLFYKYASLSGAVTRLWDGRYDSATTMQIRIVRRSDGALIAESGPLVGIGSIQFSLVNNLPVADDVLSIQIRRASGGGGSQQTIIAGFFSFEP